MPLRVDYARGGVKKFKTGHKLEHGAQFTEISTCQDGRESHFVLRFTTTRIPGSRNPKIHLGKLFNSQNLGHPLPSTYNKEVFKNFTYVVLKKKLLIVHLQM